MARGGGGRGGRHHGGELSRETQISKKLSWLLRHGAEAEGLKLGPGGYANVRDVLENRKIRGSKVTLDELRSVVAADQKSRYSLILASEAPVAEGGGPAKPADGVDFDTDFADPSNWLIRANQGHSIKVAEEGLLEAITLEAGKVPDTVVHGTTTRAWPLILKTGGLKPMTRTHVHFASGLPAGFESVEEDDGQAQTEKQPVISGMRNSSSVLIYLDAEKTLKAGVKLWRSANGVILCSGNEEGVIPLQLFKRVEERKKGGGVLLRDGQLVENKS